jgi:S-adenosylmethionine decarboxylase
VNGSEWVVEAYGCDPAALGDIVTLQALFAEMIRDLDLHPVAEPIWHRFPPPGGITGLCALAESHLACHSFPEHGSLCLNLFCCRPRREWNFHPALERLLGASSVKVRRLERAYAPSVEAPPLRAIIG